LDLSGLYDDKESRLGHKDRPHVWPHYDVASKQRVRQVLLGPCVYNYKYDAVKKYSDRDSCKYKFSV